METNIKSTIADTLRTLEEHAEKIPGSMLKESIRAKLGEIRTVLVDNRNPRIALVGRRGAGKSSFINALFGEHVVEVGHARAQTMEPKWLTLSGSHADLDILDTRGLQEGGEQAAANDPTPNDDPAVNALAELFRQHPPDVFMFLVKAKEVDASIDGDLTRLERLATGLREMGIDEVPVLGLVTQCDELEPKHVALHAQEEEDPQDVRDKLGRVREVTELLSERLGKVQGVKLSGVYPVSSYVVWDRNTGTIRRDERWQIEELKKVFFEHLPAEAIYEYVRVAQLRNLQTQIARRIADAFAMVAVGIAVVPIPVADTIPLLGVQGAMIAAIARLRHGDTPTKDAMQLIAALGINVGVGVAARELFRTIVQVFPVTGTAASGAIAWATTRALGEAAIMYYIRGERDKKVLRQAFTESLTTFRAKASSDPAVDQATGPDA